MGEGRLADGRLPDLPRAFRQPPTAIDDENSGRRTRVVSLGVALDAGDARPFVVETGGGVSNGVVQVATYRLPPVE